MLTAVIGDELLHNIFLYNSLIFFSRIILYIPVLYNFIAFNNAVSTFGNYIVFDRTLPLLLGDTHSSIYR